MLGLDLSLGDLLLLGPLHRLELTLSEYFAGPSYMLLQIDKAFSEGLKTMAEPDATYTGSGYKDSSLS